MRVALAVTEGPHAGIEFTFDRHDNFIVGRSKDAHFQLPQKDPHFSRIHFLVEVNPPCCKLLDLGSTNGTFVNGRRVKQIDLKDGDRIQGGKTVISVRFSDVTTASSPALRRQLSEEAEEDHADYKSETPARPAAIRPAEIGTQTLLQADSHPGVCVACQKRPLDFTTALEWPLCGDCLDQSKSVVQFLPDYLLVRELGRGAMGVVHLGIHRATKTVAALKTIVPEHSASPREIQRFLREADILCTLRHPNIVRFVNMGSVNNQRIFFAMEFMPDGDVARLVARKGPLAFGPALLIVREILKGLEYAHDLGYVHRDIKPGNLMVCRRSKSFKLADFGLARTYHNSCLSGLTLTGQVGGTAAFMAPEQLTHYRQSKPAVDVYSVAATLYYLLTGKFVYDFPKRVDRQLLMLLQEDPVRIQIRRPEVPDELAQLIHRGLCRNPKQRFTSAAEMRNELDLFCIRNRMGSEFVEDIFL